MRNHELPTRTDEDILYVHYAAAALQGAWVVPWDDLSESARATAGHRGSIYEHRLRDQWRSDRVYVHELLRSGPILNIGTAYSSEKAWVYEVEPLPPLEPDPELGGHLPSSFICPRATIIGCLHQPNADSFGRS